MGGAVPGVVLIGNPTSGRGSGAAALARAEQALIARGIAPVIRPTTCAGDAVRLGREAREAELVLVSGGDGTLRDVVEGLAGADVPVGLLPSGTGNDLARTLLLPRDVDAALDIALGPCERRLDVWEWNGAPFVNLAGVGLDAAVGAVGNRRFKRLRSTLAYIAAFLVVLPRFQPLKVTLTWPDGEWSGRVWLCAFANGKAYGGGMFIAPDAVPDDGLLDVVTIRDISKVELLSQFPKLFRGAHTSHPAVRIFRTDRLRTDAPPCEVSLDGEIIPGGPAEITRAPYRLRMRVPAG
jgi:YegS/Rv2252/BmrU family lipid kinase